MESLSANSIDPAHLLELTDRLNTSSVNSPLNSFQNRQSPGLRHQNPMGQSRDTPYQQPQPSRLQGTGRIGSFPTPSAYHHQQAPHRSNIPPQNFIQQPPVGQYVPPPQPATHIPYLSQRTVPQAMGHESITPWGEPEPVRHLLFTGKSRELMRFLVEIRDAIRPHQGRFMTNSRQINWVAQHFMIRDYKVSGVETASQNWFDSLLASNAQVQGKWSQFADLKSFDYVIPELLTLEYFYEALIRNFEDKDAVRTANDALDNFTQEKEKLSISDFNAKWRIMAS